MLYLIGELDLAGADAARDAILSAEYTPVVVDLSRLQFIDVIGARAVFQAHRSLNSKGRPVVIRGARGLVRRVFQLLEMDFILCPLDDETLFP